MLRVVIAAGGTTGHLSPGLAVAALLRSNGAEVLFIGKVGGPEARIVGDQGFDFKGIRIIGRGSGVVSLRNLRAATLLMGATATCLAAYRSFKPQVVLGAGGYVSLPADLAARLCRIPLVIHEQNAIPGLANRIAKRFATKIAVGFRGTEANFGSTAVLTGNPVRSAIRDLSRKQARREGAALFGIDENRKTLLIFGGSQGAFSINRAAVAASGTLQRSKIQVLHLTGAKNIDYVNEKLFAVGGDSNWGLWKTFGYLDRMDLAYACSDLVICRAGASTIAELAATGLPSILVPLPVALDDDQRHNAEAARATGGAIVVKDSDLKTIDLSSLVEATINDDQILSSMAASIKTLDMPDAAARIAALIIDAAE